RPPSLQHPRAAAGIVLVAPPPRSTPMRTAALLVALASCSASLAADEKTVLATGDWSEPVNGLRGRLILAQGRTLGHGKPRESLVYVELENVANTHCGVVGGNFD